MAFAATKTVITPPDAVVQGPAGSPGWIVFGGNGGDGPAIDLTPGPNGYTGQVTLVDHEQSIGAELMADSHPCLPGRGRSTSSFGFCRRSPKVSDRAHRPQVDHLGQFHGYYACMASWSWSDAGNVTDVMEINGIHLKPDPPEPGEVVTVTIPVHISKVVERGAWIDVTVKLGAVELVSKTYNLFGRISESDPGTGTWNLSVDKGVVGDSFEAGDAVLTVRLKIPREIPPARFAVEARACNADGHDLFALNIKVDFAY